MTGAARVPQVPGEPEVDGPEVEGPEVEGEAAAAVAATAAPMRESLRGNALLAEPSCNKDAAFSEQERDTFGLRGLMPCGVVSIGHQLALELEHLHRKSDDLERYIGLAALRDRNETLFYRLLTDHLEELAPIVYTPTVGDACRQFSHVVRRTHGLWITPEDVGRIPQLLANAQRPRVRLIVATDNERILGLGDQGAGGMGIPVGKLALYTAGAGLHPSLTLPVCLDCGTDNEDLLSDPLYLGYRQPRLRGGAYDDFIEAFVTAVARFYPHAILQWEDFKQHNAIRLLERYRHRLPSFNDDIQGTAAVVLGGIYAALHARHEQLSRQRVVLLGAGAAGLGIAQLLAAAMRREGAGAGDVARSIVLLDSRGLVYEGRDGVDDDKRAFALPASELVRLGLPTADGATHYDLETVVRHVAPTVLIGTTGCAGAFTPAAIQLMSRLVPAPIVLPLSNPTSRCEARPSDVLAWTGGRALVATGSPFDPVTIDGSTRLIGQANNVFIFPGLGLGAVVARAREITEQMFLVAASTLAEMTSADRLAAGSLYPRLADLRSVSRAIAVAVARQADESGVAGSVYDDVEAAVDAATWQPEYAYTGPVANRTPVRAGHVPPGVNSQGPPAR